MKLNRIVGPIALAAMVTGCVTASGGSVALTTKAGQPGSDAVVKLQAPEAWYVAGQKADRIDLRAPDNYSSLTVSMTSAAVGEIDCAQVALSAARGAMKPTGTAPEIKAQGELVEFSQTVPGSPPGPADRRVFGRALCRKGALAVAICSVGVEREPLANECRSALQTLTIESSTPTAPPAPVPPEAGPTQPAGQPRDVAPIPENPATAPSPEPQPTPEPVEQSTEQPAPATNGK